MNRTIKAIETVYNGYRFRSRLEARWAVFFDTLRIKYNYEPEGFDLGKTGWYLPDFWLPKQECWVEIKGTVPSSGEEEKARSLSIQSNKMTYILWGGIPQHDQWGCMDPVESGFAYFPRGSFDSQYWWCECPDCSMIGLSYNGRSDRLPCKESYISALRREKQLWRAFIDRPLRESDFYEGCPRHGGNLDKCYTDSTTRIIAAYTAARQARFEKGA